MSGDGGHDYTSVSLHDETIELVDDITPEWMPRSSFVDGVVWMVFGHMSENHRLLPQERVAIYRLKMAGVSHSLIAEAFDVSVQTVIGVQAAEGEGASTTLDEREADA